MLTFDDSTTGHYTNAYRILKKYKQIGTFFVTSHRSQISNTQLKEMSDNGMDIQSHTQTHTDLVKLNNLNQLQSEIGGSKIELEARTGKEVVALAYPGCVADAKTYNSMLNNAYLLGFSCGKSIDHRYTSRLSIARLHNPTNIEDLVKILSGRYPF
jgi:peptidoglycan/xylan/chitin deacetylase (PgdA/CDA1 family)